MVGLCSNPPRARRRLTGCMCEVLSQFAGFVGPESLLRVGAEPTPGSFHISVPMTVSVGGFEMEVSLTNQLVAQTLDGAVRVWNQQHGVFGHDLTEGKVDLAAHGLNGVLNIFGQGSVPRFVVNSVVGVSEQRTDSVTQRLEEVEVIGFLHHVTGGFNCLLLTLHGTGEKVEAGLNSGYECLRFLLVHGIAPR